jgi:hypothetical protein
MQVLEAKPGLGIALGISLHLSARTLRKDEVGMKARLRK